MIQLDKSEASLVLWLIATAGASGAVQGKDWRETASALLALEAKMRQAVQAETEKKNP